MVQTRGMIRAKSEGGEPEKKPVVSNRPVRMTRVPKKEQKKVSKAGVEKVEMPKRVQAPVQKRHVHVPDHMVDTAPLEEMINEEGQSYFYPPVVKGPYLLNVSNEVVEAATHILLEKASDTRAGPDGRWKSAEELEQNVIQAFAQILNDLHTRCTENADDLKKRMMGGR